MKKKYSFYWVSYDISNPKGRRKVIIALRKAGFRRVHFSVFFGLIYIKHVKQVREAVKQWLSPKKDRFLLIPVPSGWVGKTQQFGLVPISREDVIRTQKVVFH